MRSGRRWMVRSRAQTMVSSWSRVVAAWLPGLLFHGRPGALSRFAIVHAALDRRVQALRLSAGRACFGWLSGLSGCEHAVREDTGCRGRSGRGHSPWMTALPRVSEGELWTSFPEAVRNDILGLLSMLLERMAVSAGPVAEGTGG
jgi:hypothetical protein